MSSEEEKKKFLMPNASSAEALAKQNLRIQVEKQAKKQEEQKRSLVKLEQKVKLQKLKETQRQKSGDAGTKSTMEEAQQTQENRIDQKAQPKKMLNDQAGEKASHDQMQKVETASDQEQ